MPVSTDNTTLSPSGGVHVQEDVSEIEPTEGTRLGRYVLLELAGRGGMGAVYRAYDSRLRREVALKRVTSRADNEHEAERVQRLIREAHAMARLSHPNLAAIFDVEHLGGHVWLVMEFVRGQTLDAWLKSEPATNEILRVFHDTALGLQAVHDAGLVHRDVKPANIMLDDAGRVRVMDLGLARRGDHSDLRETENGEEPSEPQEPHADALSWSLTQDGVSLGTPLYMAPEQHGVGVVGPAADQFALCVALFEALFGQRPYDAPTYAKLIVQKSAPVQIATENRVPRRLRRVLTKGLAPQADERFVSMRALADQLSPRRRRGSWIAMLGVTGVASAALLASPGERAAACTDLAARGGAVWAEPRVAQLETRLATVAPDTVERLPALGRDLAQWSGAWAHEVSDACGLRDADAAASQARIRCLTRNLSQAQASTSALEQVDTPELVERAMDGLGSLDDPHACATTSVTTVSPAVADAAAAIDARLATVAAQTRIRGDEASLLAAQQLLTEARAVGHLPLTLRAMQLYGNALGSRERHAESAEVFRTAYLEGLGSDERHLLSSFAGAIGEIEANGAGHMPSAHTWLDTARAWQNTYAPETIDGRLEQKRARVYFAESRFDASLELARIATAAYEEKRGATDTKTLYARISQANALMGLKAFDQAQAILLDVLEDAQRDRSRRIRLLAAVHQNLGGCFFYGGDVAQAIQHTKLAAKIYTGIEPDHPSLGELFSNLAAMHGSDGDFDLAEAALTEALPHLRRNKDTTSLALALGNLASTRFARAEYAEAARNLEESLELGEDDRHVGETYAGLLRFLAVNYEQLHRPIDAVPRMRQAIEVSEKAHLSAWKMGGLHEDLGHALAQAGEVQQAAEQWRLALTLWQDVEDPEVHEARLEVTAALQDTLAGKSEAVRDRRLEAIRYHGADKK